MLCGHGIVVNIHAVIAIRGGSASGQIILIGNFSIDKVQTIEGKSFRLVNLPFYLLAALPEVLSKL